MPDDDGDWAALDAARADLGLSLDELWVAYVSVGGNGTRRDVGRWLGGEAVLDNRDRRFLAQAIHDEVVDRGGG